MAPTCRLIAFPPFFPATMLLLKAGKKGGTRSSIRNPSVYSLSPPPPFFPAFNNSIVAGKKGGGRKAFAICYENMSKGTKFQDYCVFSPPRPPFFPATMLLLKAGKKGGRREGER